MKKILLVLLIINLSCNNEKFYKEYYSNGKLKLKISLDKNGIRDGRFEEYYINGRLKSEGQYFKGQIKDSVFMYFENGRIKEKGIIYNNHKQNWWKFFDQNNKILKEEEYYEINDSASLNQYIQYKPTGEINYSKSSFYKFNIPDTLTVGQNLIDKNVYYTDKKGDKNFHHFSIIINNKYSQNKTKKDTFFSGKIENGKINPWFGIYAYKKGKMKVTGNIQETYLIYNLISKDSAEADIITLNKYFEKEVFVKDKVKK